jgi:TonB family protein
MNKLILTLFIVMIFATSTLPQTAQRTSPASKPLDSAQQELDEAARQHSLAVKLFNEKKYDEAISAAKRAAAIREARLGAEHYLTRLSLNNLAQMYVAKENYDEALRIFQRLLPIYEKTLKPGSEEEIKTLEQIAVMFFYEHKFSEAEKAYQRALEVREMTAGKESTQTASVIYHLATFYQFSGKDDQAKSYYQRAIAIWEKANGIESSEYVASLERYSCLLRKDKRDSEADELDRRASELISRMTDKALASSVNSELGVQGGVLNGKAISKVAPHYPEAARDLREQGVVVVRVLVDESGRVILACAISGSRGLLEASERAAYGWRFSPTLLSGVPVKVKGTITFNFNLQ